MMKALVLHQPWAAFIALGMKPWETRGWPTNHRGELAICAAAHSPQLGLRSELFNSAYIKAAETDGELVKAHGVVLCVAYLTDCCGTSEAAVTPREAALGDFSPGRFAWALSSVQPLLRPVAVRGRQRIFNLLPAVEDAVRRQLPGGK